LGTDDLPLAKNEWGTANRERNQLTKSDQTIFFFRGFLRTFFSEIVKAKVFAFG
jgi:hypothetical protein